MPADAGNANIKSWPRKTGIESTAAGRQITAHPHEEIVGEPASGPVWNAIMRAFTIDAYRQDAQRILSFVPEPVGYQRAGQILRSTVMVRPVVLEPIKANIASASLNPCCGGRTYCTTRC